MHWKAGVWVMDGEPCQGWSWKSDPGYYRGWGHGVRKVWKTLGTSALRVISDRNDRAMGDWEGKATGARRDRLKGLAALLRSSDLIPSLSPWCQVRGPYCKALGGMEELKLTSFPRCTRENKIELCRTPAEWCGQSRMKNRFWRENEMANLRMLCLPSS